MSYTCALLKQRLYYTLAVQSPNYLSMETAPLPRHQLIESLITQRTDDVVDTALELWEKLALELVGIIGEGGFSSLYVRSVFLSQARFPWLIDTALPEKANQPLAELRTKFAGRTFEEISAANILLLRTFSDILVTLIGEELTNIILRSAWGNSASENPVKESDHE